MEAILKTLLISLLKSLFVGWTLMIAIGILHGSWWAKIPTMGYQTAFVCGIGLSIVAGALKIDLSND